MKRQKVISVLLACLALAALALVSCDALSGPSAPGGGGRTDSAIHGTWVDHQDYSSMMGYYYIREEIFTFRSDGTWESSYNSGSDSGYGPIGPPVKGIYSTDRDTLTLTLTHIYLDQDYTTSEGWKDKNQVAAITGGDEEMLSMFTTYIITYNVSGNTLTLYWGGDSETYTRK